MPKSGGLPDVSQKISVDSSAAVSGYQAAADAAEDFATRNASALRSMQDDLRQAKQMLDDFQRQVSGTTGVPVGIGEWEAVMAAQRLAKQGITEYASEVEDAGEAVEDLAFSVGILGNAFAAANKAAAGEGNAGIWDVDAVREFRVNVEGVAEAVKAIDFMKLGEGGGIDALNEQILTWDELHMAIKAIPQAYELVTNAAGEQRLAIEHLSDIQKQAMDIARGFATSQSDVRVLVDSAGNAITNLSSGFSGLSGNVGSVNDILDDHIDRIGKAVEKYNSLGSVISTMASSGGTVGQGFQGGGSLYDLAQAILNAGGGGSGGGSGFSDFIAGAIGAAVGSMVPSGGGGGFSGGGSSYYGSYGDPRAITAGPSYVRGYTDTGAAGHYSPNFAYDDMLAAASAGSWSGGSADALGFPAGTAGAHTGGGGGWDGGSGGTGGLTGGIFGGSSSFRGGGIGSIGDVGKIGSAAWYADNVTKWVKRVWPYVHYTTMAMAELAATVIPAAVALGSASLVGLQGGQQMYTRINAINDVMQSLGQAYGGTTGSFLGLQPKLQQLQNYAQGGVYELGGAGINMVKSGFGSAFGPEGVQTIAMIDRGVADMQNNLQSRGTGAQLGNLLSSGPDYLRQFGDIGSNIGNLILGVAPHLPGVGDDWISTIEGITGGLAGGAGFLNRNHMGDVIGGLMAGEAGWRLGTPLVGLAGKGLGGLGTLASKIPFMNLGETGITSAMAAEQGLDASLIGEGGEGLAGLLTGAGGTIGALGGPAVAGLALSAFLGSKLVSSMPSPAQRQVSALQDQITKSGFTAGFDPLAKAITTTTGLGIAAGQTSASQEGIGATETYSQIGRFGPMGETTAQIYKNAATGFSKTMGDLIESGPQLVTALDKMGLKGTSTADAFQIAQNSLLDLTHAFDSHGHLNKQAMTMIGNYVSALTPMTQNAGALGAAIGSQTIMSQGSTKQLQQVNQSMDSMTSVMTGGAAGMASLFSLLGGAPVTHKVGGINLAAPPSYSSFAKALTSYTSPTGSAAWNTFAGSNGLISTEQQNLDQIRTALTLTAGTSQPFTVRQGQGLAGFQLEQLLPMAKNNPAALAMVMQQAAQVGIGSGGPNGGYYDTTKTLAQNYKDAEQSIGGIADSTKKANEDTNSMGVKLSQIPTIAKQFSTTLGTTLQSQEVAKAATDITAIQKDALKGGIDKSAVSDWVSTLKTAGISGGAAIQQTLDAQLKQMGIDKDMIGKINAQVGPSSAGTAKTAVQVDDSKVKQLNAEMAKLQSKEVTVKALGSDAEIKQVQQEMNALRDKTLKIEVQANLAAIAAAQAAINAIHGKSVTVTITEVNRVLTQEIGQLTQPGGVAPATLAGSGGGMRLTNSATGMRVPGFGGGDIFPAMLEPGEAVVPKHLVGMIAPLLSMHGVPGFATGGLVGSDMMDAFSIARNMTTSALGGGNMSGQQWQNIFASLMRAAMIARQMQSATGFATGGIVPDNTLAGIKDQLTAEYKILDAMYAANDPKSQIDAFWSSALDPLYAKEDALEGKKSSSSSSGSSSSSTAAAVAKDFSFTLSGAIANAIKNSSDASSIASALISKIGTEIAYAKNVSGAALAGTGYGTTGLLSTFTAPSGPSGANAAPPGARGYNAAAWNAAVSNAANDTAPAQSVQQQMQSYLGTVNSFTKDLHTLTKEGLSKSLISQLIAAGPTQGDSLAQSIMSDPSGVKGANSLWAAIGKASNKLGAQASMSQYGGYVSPSLTSASASTNNISINISAGSGAGSSGLSLSASQIKAIVEQVQAALLKQAKRNPKTGLKLTGKGS